MYERTIMKLMKLLTIKEISKLLRLSERTIYRLIEAGKLKVIKFSRKATRIDEKDLNQFIKKHKTK